MNIQRQIRGLSDTDLRRHLQLEAKRGIQGSWAYSFNLHLALADEVKRREQKREAAA